jgi:hypothetical protein
MIQYLCCFSTGTAKIRYLVVGHWLLDISSWTVAVGIWLLAIGFELNLNG